MESHPDKKPETERIQKYLAQCGIGSRRYCEELVKKGKVTVNGEKAEVGQKVTGREDIEVEGKPARLIEKEYYVVNKPMGVICSNVREKGMKRVIDLIPGAEEKGMFTVGRLDVPTSGLIIVTNDGDFANDVIHPSKGYTKEYIAEIKGGFGEKEKKRLAQGVLIGGKRRAKGEVKKWKSTSKGTKVWLSVHEGRTHIVRRMLENLGRDVVSLVRIRIGPLTMGKLAPGEYRALDPQMFSLSNNKKQR